ncbi:cupin domain-containing protein [Luteibacter aegosomatis]|uniref:cupin domain-containing protein n=1 Tax=Luteibacter aegosomatis TaxID=2911537 RepID=UPI001FF94082|nr:cupin domain-containing protein [Luteibacter aegosomatis]UPG84620.1 cupin domain-containing protein [Luteibacter aegosomatis]
MSNPSSSSLPVAVLADEAPPRLTPSNYPEPFASMMEGRIKRPLGDLFGLKGFGVNHVTLPPGAISALHHRHSVQDEFVFVLTGELTLVHDAGETLLQAGYGVGFPSGGTAHHLVNRSDAEATYLEVGDRRPGDSVSYPKDDLQAVRTASGWRFEHKDGRPY